MPPQRPGVSKQDYATDPLLTAAVVKRFGPLVLDLAASEENTQAMQFIDEEMNALSDEVDWDDLPIGNRWLNPPFAKIGPWAYKCACSATVVSPILFHVPAAVGSNWFRDYVDGKAYVLFLNGRVTYVGHTQPYIKDTLVAVYGLHPGYEVWNWRA